MKANCPSCHHDVEQQAEQCPFCGFNAALLTTYYGKEAPFLTLLCDETGVLRRSEKNTLNKAQARFTKKFPGAFFSVYLSALQSTEEIESKGLWLLNYGLSRDLPSATDRASGILLFIDPTQKGCALSYGNRYAGILSQKQAFRCLSSGYNNLYRSRYHEAVQQILRSVTRKLSRVRLP